MVCVSSRYRNMLRRWPRPRAGSVASSASASARDSSGVAAQLARMRSGVQALGSVPNSSGSRATRNAWISTTKNAAVTHSQPEVRAAAMRQKSLVKKMTMPNSASSGSARTARCPTSRTSAKTRRSVQKPSMAPSRGEPDGRRERPQERAAGPVDVVAVLDEVRHAVPDEPPLGLGQCGLGLGGRTAPGGRSGSGSRCGRRQDRDRCQGSGWSQGWDQSQGQGCDRGAAQDCDRGWHRRLRQSPYSSSGFDLYRLSAQPEHHLLDLLPSGLGERPLLLPVRLNPHRSSTRCEATLSPAVEANTGRVGTCSSTAARAAPAKPRPQ